MDMGITRIGRCAGCEASSKLEPELCPECLPRYGRRLGDLFRKVRDNPHLARACYARLPAGRQRGEFERMFGKPEVLGLVGSG